MLQVFYIDVIKVDQDVAHIAMVFSSVCPKCFIYFQTYMLQVFHLDIGKVDQDVCNGVFKCMSQIFHLFQTYMLQVFHLDVRKVDQDVAHIAMVFSSVCPKCFICFRHICCKCFICMLKK
jgi:hypothetical protein